MFRHINFIFPRTALKSLILTGRILSYSVTTHKKKNKKTYRYDFSSVSTSLTSINKTVKASKINFFSLSSSCHVVCDCNQRQSLHERQILMFDPVKMYRQAVRVAVLWEEASRRAGTLPSSSILSLLSFRPSSTGRAAFTESSETVFHSTVSSSFVYHCSYSAKSKSSSKDLGSVWTGSMISESSH